CGTPVDQARKVIAEIEPFDRGYYAGMVGWCDASGDGEWVVAIRCAEIEDEVLRLFAGAGIVEGSDPASELAETTAKFRTALSAMGLE
ncbi:chorismate-binding protein, partial [Klebsiella pneumoniae]|nr:chorismate-binding protein [Klebsiella pneumoniae]